MREQQRLVKAGALSMHPAWLSHACERLEPAFGEGEGHKGGARFCDRLTKLARDIIGQPCCTHLGNGFATGRDHQIARLYRLTLTATFQNCREHAIRVAQVRQ